MLHDNESKCHANDVFCPDNIYSLFSGIFFIIDFYHVYLNVVYVHIHNSSKDSYVLKTFDQFNNDVKSCRPIFKALTWKPCAL